MQYSVHTDPGSLVGVEGEVAFRAIELRNRHSWEGQGEDYV